MEFLLLLHGDESTWEQADEEQRAATYAAHRAFLQALADAGVTVTGGAELTHSRTACVVRGQGADAVVTDGPFTEAREQLAGFYAIDVPAAHRRPRAARRPARRSGPARVPP